MVNVILLRSIKLVLSHFVLTGVSLIMFQQFEENQRFVPSAVMNHIAEIDSQKIGRTVADDSLLMKFMVTASGENI